VTGKRTRAARPPRMTDGQRHPVEVRPRFTWKDLSESWQKRLAAEFGATPDSTKVLSTGKVVIDLTPITSTGIAVAEFIGWKRR
jgi:hypothetical protein